ncbi:aminodeoxychorismate synthase, component I [Halarchaeum sp. CBA1220]|uniref:aminodeoxychorismate synthase, component I n=1 Tax=Halarchaeum sp. CBA1220 TaxID=1853682 RepID=UPI000F3A8B77|nr:aminodeoxychorismate synthase, component I [Halarchaeum sp. CBA1220]QLC33899.1 aminodeoxychorismate synthase, component I [Halarchaeum sp. CBA1220]
MSDADVRTERAAFAAAARDAPPGARVPVEVRVAVDDPFDAYRRARGTARGASGEREAAIFYETGGGRDGWGYFGVDPVATTTVGPDETGVFDAIDDLLTGETLVRAGCDVPYPGGFFGYLSYDAARETEAIPETTTDDRGVPRLELATFEVLAAWRDPFEAGDDLRVVATPRLDDYASPEAAYADARERALALAERATEGAYGDEAPPAPGADATFESDTGRAAFAERVARIKAEIRAGETFQTNVSQRLRAPAAVHPVRAYAALREVNPAPYAGLLEFPGCDLVSASPELLLERRGDELLTEPIAGTRPRGETEAADAAYEAELTSDEKERAEHAMLVDLERNDLAKVSEAGSVAVEEYRRIDRYSRVMHLVSLVSGTLREGATLGEAVRALFPGGTITGAPKPRTMALVDEVEATRRGPYTGSMAAIGFDGDATLNIVIRTLVRTGAEYGLRVGAGVVHDSDPESEYDETLAKARALVDAVDRALADADLEVER